MGIVMIVLMLMDHQDLYVIFLPSIIYAYITVQNSYTMENRLATNLTPEKSLNSHSGTSRGNAGDFTITHQSLTDMA